MGLQKSYIYLALWVLILVVVGSVIGYATNAQVNIWYEGLEKSPLTPPSYVFGVVWPILYALIGFGGWSIWQSGLPKLKNIKIFYILQLIINWAWSPLFFKLHCLGAAFACILLLVIIVSILVIKMYNLLRFVSFVFLPYLLWLVFAGYLNFYILMNN
jgi:benzodiazapine receptor